MQFYNCGVKKAANNRLYKQLESPILIKLVGFCLDISLPLFSQREKKKWFILMLF